MKALKLALILALAASLTACGGDDGGGGGGGGGGDGGGGGGDSYSYVVSFATLGAASGNSAPGFNLDGSKANACGDETTVVDYTAQAPETGDGVDNQLLALADDLKDINIPTDDGDLNLDLDAFLKEAVADGKFALLLQVSGVDSLESDNSVNVSAFLGDVEGDDPPATSGGKITAGQTFAKTTTIKTNASGSITGGRLSVTLDQLDVTIPVSTYDTTITLSIADVRLKFDIDEDSLSNGVLGGALNVNATVAEIGDFLAAAEIDFDVETIVEPILESRADLNATGDVCADVSAALVFEGVDATIQ